MLAVPANVTSLPIWKLGVKVNVFRASSLKFFKDGTVHLLYLSGNLPAEHVRQVPQCCWYLHQSDLPWAAHAPLQQVLSDPLGISYDSLFAIGGNAPFLLLKKALSQRFQDHIWEWRTGPCLQLYRRCGTHYCKGTLEFASTKRDLQCGGRCALHCHWAFWAPGNRWRFKVY